MVIENGVMGMEGIRMKENEIVLPEGWEVKKLGEFLDFAGGGTPDKSQKGYWDGDIPWASVKDVKERYLTRTQDSITKEGLNASASQMAKVGDVILITRISPGKTTIAKIDTAINQDLKIIRPKIKIGALFLHYLFETIGKEIVKASSGTTVLGIRLETLKEIPIPLPPIAEQHRIVSKIEELFSELEKGKEQILLAQQQLKTYRQAVLKWAFEGRLTNADVVDGVLPEGWETVTLSDVADSCLGKMLDKQKNRGDLKPYLGNINVRWNSFQLDDLSEMRFEASEQKRFGVVEGDLIICEGGEPGRAAIWKGKKEMMIQKALHRVRFGKRATAPYFLHYLFLIAQSKELQKYFTGTTIKHLTGGSLKKVTFPLAPLEEQHRIVQEIESRLSVCDAMEATLQTSLAQAEVLRQSILKRAFEGRLD